MTTLNKNTLDSGDIAPTEAMRKVCTATCADRLKTTKSWEQFQKTDLAAFKALLTKNNLKLGP